MDKLKIDYKLVDTAGQITAVVFGEMKRERQSPVAKSLMKNDPRIEQVVFIVRNRIQTMGNELCINGSLAGAFLTIDPKIEISGLNKLVRFTKENGSISGKFPINLLINKTQNLIQLTGIVYIISNNKKLTNKNSLSKLANKYSVPASGIISYEENKIKPLIYVKDTDSLVWENACGSGSLAYSIFSGFKKIKQPSNKFIEIERDERYFTIKVDAKIVK